MHIRFARKAAPLVLLRLCAARALGCRSRESRDQRRRCLAPFARPSQHSQTAGAGRPTVARIIDERCATAAAARARKWRRTRATRPLPPPGRINPSGAPQAEYPIAPLAARLGEL